jgi:hypothetical protein
MLLSESKSDLPAEPPTGTTRMPKLSVDLLPVSPLSGATTPTLFDLPLEPLPTSRLTELSLSRMSMSSPSLDPPPELVPSTTSERLFLDPLPELDPSTKTENDPSLGSETPSVPVLVPVVEPLLLVRLSLTTDNGPSNNKSDPEAFLFTMTRTTGLPTGLYPPTGLSPLSVTDPSLTS